MTTTNSPDWPEDFASPTCNTSNKCLACGRIFVGAMNRLSCKICDEHNNTVMVIDVPGYEAPTTAANPAKFLNDFFKRQKAQAYQRAEQKYVAATVGTPMNRKQRRQQMKGKKK